MRRRSIKKSVYSSLYVLFVVVRKSSSLFLSITSRTRNIEGRNQGKLMHGVSKIALPWYSRCYCMASVTKTSHLKACKLSIVQGVDLCIVCTPLSVNVFVTLVSDIWNTIVKLFLKHCITSGSRIEP
jgi:hypothetical protein